MSQNLQCLFAVLLTVALPTTGAWADEIPSEPDAEDLAITIPAIADDDESDEPGILDRLQLMMHGGVEGVANRVDRFIGGSAGDDVVTRHRSKADISMDVLIDDTDSDVNLDLDITVDIKLPRSEERLGLFLTTSSPEELPGDSPEEVNNSVIAGLQKTLSLKRIAYANASVGVKIGTSPELVGQIKLAHEFKGEKWDVLPYERMFWASDNGFGEVTGLSMNYWLKKRVLARSHTAARWTEESRGVEWEQSVLLGYTTKKARYKGLDQGIALRGSVFGYKNGGGKVDRYQVALIGRKAMFRPWLFIRMGPEVEWLDEEHWDPIYSFRIGLDALFWAAQDLRD